MYPITLFTQTHGEHVFTLFHTVNRLQNPNSWRTQEKIEKAGNTNAYKTIFNFFHWDLYLWVIFKKIFKWIYNFKNTKFKYTWNNCEIHYCQIILKIIIQYFLSFQLARFLNAIIECCSVSNYNSNITDSVKHIYEKTNMEMYIGIQK